MPVGDNVPNCNEEGVEDDPLYDTADPLAPPVEYTPDDDHVYDVVPLRTQRRISTEIDGFADKFASVHRARTQAHSMARPPRRYQKMKDGTDVMEMAEIKQARLSTDVNQMGERPEGSLVISRDEDAIVETCDVPSSILSRQATDDVTAEDIYSVPHISKEDQVDDIHNVLSLPIPVDAVLQSPSHSETQLPPSRPPPDVPAPAIPARDSGSSCDSYVSLDQPCNKSRDQLSLEQLSRDNLIREQCSSNLSSDTDPEYVASDPALDLIYGDLCCVENEMLLCKCRNSCSRRLWHVR